MFESEAHTERGSPSLVGRGIANPQLLLSQQQQQQSPLGNTRFTLLKQNNNNNFKDYLKAQNKRNIRQIICYAKRYATVLDSGDATPLVNLRSNTMRRHTLEALANLAKFQGRYDVFLQLRQKYSLKWTTNNSLQSFEHFFNPELTFDTLLQRVKEMIHVLPTHMAAVVRFNCLTGLRPSEACESVRLLNIGSDNFRTYYNPERQCLQHFLYPQIFHRKTKCAYVSFITKDLLSGIGVLDSGTTTWTAIRHTCRRRGLSMDMRYCRKLFASWLHRCNIPVEIIDMLQGRIPKSIFAKHYLVLKSDFKADVLQAVEKLQKEIEEEH
jgi:intergrase/recombinase